MATRQIDKHEWVEYFNQFSRDNQGKTVTLREEGLDVGAQEDVTARTFVGISSDRAGSAAGSTPQQRERRSPLPQAQSALSGIVVMIVPRA